MCGIAGYLGLKDEQTLDNMLNRMIHRGPDEVGKYTELGLGIGIRRLSIIDVEGGQQPATNEKRNIWVVLNGEIYNYRELRNELLAKGHQFSSQSDTEIIVHLYEELGEEMVHRLRGMFSIALWDSRKEVFLLIRDRLGIKPLYYANTDDGGLVFASEVAAIREALPECSISPQAIAQYLTLLYVPAPRSIFTKVRQLLPGQILRDQGETRTVRTYFEISSKAKPISTLPPDELQEQFRAKLKDAVQSHLVSDVPLGLLLSGGLDSASILAMMRSVTSGSIHTFSIGYKDDADKDFNEISEARALAERFGANHTEELLSPDITDILPRVVRSMGEPFGDSSAIVTYLVSEVARKSVTVALSGIGGDELFGGYPRHLGIQLAKYYQLLPASIRSALAGRIAPLFKDAGTHRNQSGRIRRFLQNGSLSLCTQYANWVSFRPHGWTEPIFADDFAQEVDTQAPTQLLEGFFRNWPYPDPADKAMGTDLQTYLPDDLLKMGDRMSMAHSLELRVPFCDHELLEFALQVPRKLRFKNMQLKGFMRDSLRKILPGQTIEGPKKGFMVPLARWLRDPLHDMVHDLLTEHRITQRGYLNPRYVEWLISEHESGRRNFADQIYSLLVLEIWMDQRRASMNDDVTFDSSTSREDDNNEGFE